VGKIFLTCPDRPWGPRSLLYNGYRVFPAGKERSGRDADPASSSSAVVKKEYSYTSTPPMGRTACTEPQCLYKGAVFFLPTNEQELDQLGKGMVQSCSGNKRESPAVYSA